MAFLDEPPLLPRWKRTTIWIIGLLAALSVPVACLMFVFAQFLGDDPAYDVRREIVAYAALLAPIATFGSTGCAVAAYRYSGQAAFRSMIALFALWCALLTTVWIISATAH